MAYDERALRGVGGWLAFFVLTLAVFGPLRSVAGLAGNLYADPAVAAAYGPNWGAVQAVEWTLTLASIAASWFLAWRLVRVQVPATVPLVIAGLWLVPAVAQTLDAVAIAVLSGTPLARILAVTAPGYVGAAFYAAIWTAYLKRSRRVANTYADDAGGAAEAFE